MGVMAHLGRGRQPSVSGAVVGALISGAGGGCHPRRAPLPGTVVQSQGPWAGPTNRLLSAPRLVAHAFPIPSVCGWGGNQRSRCWVVVGEQGVEAGCRSPQHGEENGFLAAFACCLQVLALPAAWSPAWAAPRPTSQAARFAASLLDADFELPLLFPDALSQGLLEAPRLTSQHCSCPGGAGPTAGIWGCSNSLQLGEGKRLRRSPARQCLQSTEDACVNKPGSFISKLVSWVFVCVWMDPTRLGGRGGGSSSVGFPRRRRVVGLGGWVIRFDVCLAADMVK